jgi:hypothetical protein
MYYDFSYVYQQNTLAVALPGDVGGFFRLDYVSCWNWKCLICLATDILVVHIYDTFTTFLLESFNWCYVSITNIFEGAPLLPIFTSSL